MISSDFCRGLVADDVSDQTATADAFAVFQFIAGRRLAQPKAHGERRTVLHDEAEGFKAVVDQITTLKAGALRRRNARAVAYGRKVKANPTLGVGSIIPAKVQNPKPVAHC